jgi:phosphonate transport system substrate-binding protein
MTRARSRRSFLIQASGIAAALKTPLPVAAEPAEKGRVIRFGVIAEQAHEPDRMLRVYSDLLSELRRRLAATGIEVAELVITRDLEELARQLDQGRVDMVAETVFVTLDLQKESTRALTPRLAIVKRDQREYHSVFFSSKEGSISKLEHLRGRTLVLQAERSTSAFAVPRAELSRRGIPSVPLGQPGAPDGSAYYVLAGAELNQAVWVLRGKGDAGAFNEGDWARLPQKIRDGLRIFHETRPLLRGLVSFRAGLPAAAMAACEDALLALNSDNAGRAALSKADGITRFEGLTPADLAGLNEWRRALRGAS